MRVRILRSAPCYVPARSGSDGGSSSPRPLSPPLFQHHRFKDSTSSSKDLCFTDRPPAWGSRIRSLWSDAKVCTLGFILPEKVQGSNFTKKRKEKKYIYIYFYFHFFKSDFPIGETIWQGKGFYCKYFFIYTVYILFKLESDWHLSTILIGSGDHWGIWHAVSLNLAMCTDVWLHFSLDGDADLSHGGGRWRIWSSGSATKRF